MTTRTFAAWVEPIARQLAEGRKQVIEFAKTAPPDLWNRPSGAEGWTCKDVLAHLAGDTEKVSAAVMRGMIEDPSVLDDNGDAANARDLEERRERSVDALIAEIESDGEEWQRLLGELGEGDTDRRLPGFPLSVGEYLRLMTTHDLDHLAQIRMALEKQR